ncbi:DUF6132 family protein [Candidatus Omnitrophota bacterium]
MKIVLGVVIGGTIGFLIGHFGKCASGACPLTSNPIISTLIGASLGLMFAMIK